MEENINLIYEDVISSCRSCNELLERLKSITGSSVIVGNGGSRVVATFLAKVLSKKNKIITSIHDSCDLSSLELSNFDNIIVCSYSGKNEGVKHALSYNNKKYMLTTRKSSIDDETLLTYDMEPRKSFISLNQSIVPMAIILKYYLKDKFEYIIDDIFRLIDININYNLIDITNIFTDYNTLTVSTFIESTLAESGLSAPLVHSKYDYCHGRSTINKGIDYRAIYLINEQKELDDAIISILKEPLILKGPFKDEIVNEFYLTLLAIHLLKNISKDHNVNLSKIDYDRDVVKKLYNFKGSM